MGKTVGITFNNSGDGLTISKNLWLHLGCVDKLCRILKKEMKVNMPKVVANAI